MILSNQQKAYIAGLFDADGSYTLSKTINKLGYTMYDPLVRFTTEYKPTANWVVKTLGGKIKEKPKGHKIHNEWRFMNDVIAKQFMDQVLPFITIKRQEAEVLMKYYALRGIWNKHAREALYQEMVGLKETRPVTTNTLDFPFQEEYLDDYFAGFFDGEGSIYLTDTGKNLRLDISLGNTYQPIIPEYQKRYGGNVRPRDPHNGILPSLEWSLTRPEDKIPFLETMFFLLRTKRKQAELGLFFLNNHKDIPREDQQWMKEALSVLNGKKIESVLVSDYESASTLDLDCQQQTGYPIFVHDKTAAYSAALG